MAKLLAVPGMTEARSIDPVTRPRSDAFEAVLSQKSSAPVEERRREPPHDEDERTRTKPAEPDVETAMRLTVATPAVKAETPRAPLSCEVREGAPADAAASEASGGERATRTVAEAREATAVLASLGEVLHARLGECLQNTVIDRVSWSRADVSAANDAAEPRATPQDAKLALETPAPKARLDPDRRDERPRAPDGSAVAGSTDATPGPADPGSSDAGSQSFSSSADGTPADPRGDPEPGGQRPEVPGLAFHGEARPDVRHLATAGAGAASAPGAVRQASEVVERIVSQARELRETAGGREISFEVHGEADQKIKVHLSIHEDRSLHVSFDATDRGVVHAMREKVEVLRVRLHECGFDAAEVSFKGWDAGSAAGETLSDHRRRHAPATPEDDGASATPGNTAAASARATRATEVDPTPPAPAIPGRLSVVA